MSWLWMLPLLLAGSLVWVGWPLWSRRGAAPLPVGLEDNPAAELEDRRDNLLRQLKECEYETASPTLRVALEEELGEVLTQLDQATPAAADVGATGALSATGMERMTGVVMALSVVLLTGGLYAVLGTPAVPLPGASPPAAGQQGAEMEAAITKLAERLRGTPDDLEGWTMLGRSYAALGRQREAVEVYTHVLSRQPDNLDVAVALAEVELQAGDPSLFQLGVQMLDGVLKRQPQHLEALWLRGAVAYRDGEGTKAAELWSEVLKQLPPDEPSRAKVEKSIADARALPTSGK